MNAKRHGTSMAPVHERAAAILQHLRQDSRKGLAAIAREEGVAVSTVFDHVHKLRRDIITRYVPLLDHAKLGHPFRTFFFCDTDDDEAIKAYLERHPGTNNLYQLSGGRIGADMLFPTLQDEERCREHLEERGCAIEQHKVLTPLLLEEWMPERKQAPEHDRTR